MLNEEVKKYVERLWNERKISYNWTDADETSLINFIKERIEESKTAGIVSYLASPLAPEQQYAKETGRKIKKKYSEDDELTITWYPNHYVEWLTMELIKARAR